MNGHPLQNEAAAQRDPMEAWRGIVALVEGGHSPIDVSGISSRRAILAVNERLNALEAAISAGSVKLSAGTYEQDERGHLRLISGIIERKE